jgi:hypothetical protein
MTALEKKRTDGRQHSERHSLSAVTPHRPSINVRTSPPEHLAQFTMLDLAPSSVFSQLLARRLWLYLLCSIQVPDYIACDLYLPDIVIRDFHAGEFGFNR